MTRTMAGETWFSGVRRLRRLAARVRASLGTLTALSLVAGCARAPSPLAPNYRGSIGMPHRGSLTLAVELPKSTPSLVWLRQDDRHWGIPRFVESLQRAADAVAQNVGPETPKLAVGDLSTRRGGQLLPHLSHRSGRDVDLLLYLTTLSGAPVPSPGFLRVGPDGLAWDAAHHRYLRFDVAREWELVKALVTDREGRIQFVFAHRTLEAMMIEYALAKGEDPVTVFHAEEVLLQPTHAEPHDDHVHVRAACSPEDVAGGCEPSGPLRSWLAPPPSFDAPDDDDETDERLALSLFEEMGAGGAPSASKPTALGTWAEVPAGAFTGQVPGVRP